MPLHRLLFTVGLACGLLLIDPPATPAEDAPPIGIRVGAVATYDLPGKARWDGDDLAEYLENPWPLGAGATAELRAGRTRLSFTWFTSRNLQDALPSLDLSGPLKGSFGTEATMDMGPLVLETDTRVDIDARWSLRGSGYRWRLGRRMIHRNWRWAGYRFGVHADVFGFDMLVDLDGRLVGDTQLRAEVGGIPLAWTTKTDSPPMESRVDLHARGVTLGAVPTLVLLPGGWFELELGPRLELKTMGVEYELRMDGEEIELPDAVQFGRTHRSAKVGYHVRLLAGPFWIEGNDDSGFADEWSTGLRVELP